MKVPKHSYFIKTALLWCGIGLSLSGCFEVREELHMNYDGSGTYRLSLDLSENRTLLHKILLIEKNRPEGSPVSELLSFLQLSFAQGSSDFADIPGISQSVAINQPDSLVFGFSFAFDDVGSLNQALALNHFSTHNNVYTDPYFSYRKGKLAKDTTFYLHKLIAGQRSQPAADSVFRKGTYSFLLVAPGKIKRFHYAPDSLLSVTRHRAQIRLPLGQLADRQLATSFEAKFKRR